MLLMFVLKLSRMKMELAPRVRFWLKAPTALVPDLVTAFTDAPECMPLCADRPLVATRNSCSA